MCFKVFRPFLPLSWVRKVVLHCVAHTHTTMRLRIGNETTVQVFTHSPGDIRSGTRFSTYDCVETAHLRKVNRRNDCGGGGAAE